VCTRPFLLPLKGPGNEAICDLCILRLCAWAESTWGCCWYIGMANKTQCLQRSWALLNDSKHNKAIFSTDSLYLWVAQMPIDLQICQFWWLHADRRTKLIALRMCTRGNDLAFSGSCKDWTTLRMLQKALQIWWYLNPKNFLGERMPPTALAD
jgi:hypothetical protein